jgi:hypothetical protein
VVGWSRGFGGVALLGALCVLGCGGESEGSGCSAFSACGGDPTGVWQSQAVCMERGFDAVIDAQDLPAQCQTAMRVGTPRPESTLTVNPDGSFTETGAMILPWSMRWDVPCVSALSEQPITLAQMPTFCDSFQAQIGNDPSSVFASLNCQVVVDVCSCSATQLVTIQGSGTSEIQGTSIVFSDGTTREFCIEGDEFRLRSEDATFGGTVSTYIRATP